MSNVLSDRTPEQRKAALRKATEIRAARAALLADLHDGRVSLADVFARVDSNDAVATRTRVRAILIAHPGVGPVTADKTLENLSISPRRRLQGVGPLQRERLLQWSAERFGAQA